MALVKRRIRVLLVDDHPVIRHGIKALAELHNEIEVVGEATDGRAAHVECVRLKPDVAVMDISMPNLDGVKATELILRDCPHTKVVALSVHEERMFVQQILKAGASAYVLKRTALEELVRAIRTVHSGGTYLDPAIAKELVSPNMPGESPARGVPKISFSEREGDVAQLIVRGFTNKEIATQLNLSIKTIETYKMRVFAKLNIQTRADLVRHAMDHGWFEG